MLLEELEQYEQLTMTIEWYMRNQERYQMYYLTHLILCTANYSDVYPDRYLSRLS